MVFAKVPHIGYYAASLMNAVILTAVLSCGNSAFYVSTRMLYAMACVGKAPRTFSSVSPRGVPVRALLATGVVGALAFFSSYVGDQKIYQLLYNASSLTGFLIWLGIAICHLRFRRAWIAQGRSVDELRFKAKFYPYGTWLSLMLFVAVLFGANASVFSAQPFSWFDFITSYLMIPVFLMLYFGHKSIKKTRIVPLQDCRF